MKRLLYILVLTSAAVWGLNNRCCEEGRVLLKRKVACWDPVSNSTVNITLACAERGKRRTTYNLNEDGSLTFYEFSKLMTENISLTVEPGNYCVGEQTTLSDVKLESTEKVFVFCFDNERIDLVSADVKIYCMLVSSIFLALTAALYSLITELRDLLGKCIINYCISAALAFLLFFIMERVSYSDMTLCAVKGFLTYFFIMASFFWTNAISIQILISMRRSHLYDRGWREFMWYAVYAWGCAAALTICVIVANYHPGDHKRPGIGLNHCWFYYNHAWYYFYSVMGVLIITNILIFSWCLYQLWSPRFESSHIKAMRYKCMMSLRLFMLMGVPWILEIISSTLDSGVMNAIIDVVTALQGVLTFVVLVLLRKRALKMMLKRGWLFCLAPLAEKRLAMAEDLEDIVQDNEDHNLDHQNKH